MEEMGDWEEREGRDITDGGEGEKKENGGG
jgi:hypothetical protein